MSHVMRISAVSVATLAVLLLSENVAAEEETPAVVAEKPALAAPSVATAARANPMGIEPLDSKILARRRGAADVYNDMQLRGVVADNRAVNVATGNNLITEGAFSGAAGVPMVVQNSGNNVLIQNATIINLQVK
jgi:hypothetical protein